MHADRLARWSRWRLLAAWWGIQSMLVVAAWSVGIVTFDLDFKSPVGPALLEGVRTLVDAMRHGRYWTAFGLSLVVVGGLQAAILAPVRRPAPVWTPGGAGQGRSMWATIAAAGLMCGALWGGVVLVAADAVWLAADLDWSESDEAWRWLVIPPLLGWVAATPLLVRFVQRGRREDRLGRLASRLLVGTAIEVAAIIPLDVMVRRRTNCYCERGTFLALVACGTVGLAALGPAVLLPLLSRQRKRWYAGRCEVCLYDMRATPRAERCPECGSGWRAPSEQKETSPRREGAGL